MEEQPNRVAFACRRKLLERCYSSHDTSAAASTSWQSSRLSLRAFSSSSTNVVAIIRARHLSSCGVREWRNASFLRSDAVHCCSVCGVVKILHHVDWY